MKNGSFFEVIEQSRFLRSVLTLTSASAVGQLIMLAALPLLTRLYTPESFGVLAVFSALMGVVLVVSSLRYEMAIPLPRSDRNASQLLVLALLINLVTAGVTAAVVLLMRHNIAAWAETPALANLLWLLPVSIMTAGSYKALNFWAVRNRDYKRIARTRISQSFANVTAQVAAGLAGLGALGLIIGQIIGQSVGVSRLAQGIGLRWFWQRSKDSPLRNRALVKAHNRFPKYDVPAAGVNAFSVQLPNFALAVLFNPAVAGFYYLAERVLGTPMSMVGQAVAQVLYGQSREDMRNGVFYHTVRRVLLTLTLIIAPPALIVFVFAEPAFVLLFGEPWREAGVYAGWLIIGLAVQFVYSPLSMVLMATEGQLVNLGIHSFILLMKFGALLTGFLVGDVLLGIKGLALALFAGYGLGIFLVVSRVRRVSI